MARVGAIEASAEASALRPRPYGRLPVPAGGWARLGFVAASLAGLIVLVWLSVLPGDWRFYDAYAYHDVRLDDVYGRSFGQLTALGAFRYSPPVAFLAAPLGLLPEPIFFGLWTALLCVALIWTAGPWALAACVMIGVPMSIWQGNVDLLIAASIVLAFRWPGWWAAGILLKVTPGLGLLWYAVRGEWRRLAIALAVTLAIVLPTVVLRPDLWVTYVAMLADDSGASEAAFLAPRLAIAALVIAYAARTERPWLVPLAIALAQPSFGLRSASVAVAALASVPRGRSGHLG